ncbi:MAG: dihydroorotase [Flavobacteriales bacterium]|nr:dihydroorotase [Flavobacteriales bacterium]MDP4731548.1 dihydroorotase [Flavobacteriales bacterium]MDP4818125.1 dihydroorotase [Flavobacteriales bacterium]MDP4951102.1 dihydroorotase [Flavobacteriales bacterium]
MKTLIQNAKLFAPLSKHHLKIMDVEITNGVISAIGKNLPVGKSKVIAGKDHLLSIAFTDLRANFGEPGFEQNESLRSGIAAAKKGGYARVCLMPSLMPVTDNQGAVQFLTKQNTDTFQILPLGSLSKEMKGKQLTEFAELQNAGAIGFTEDEHAVSTELMMRALEYSKQTNTRIFVAPNDYSVHPKAQMHEGKTSVKMGLKGASELSETLRIQRDLALLKYTGGSLHFYSISTAKGLEMIRKAKKEELQVTCSIAAHQLSFTHEDMIDYDSNKKVWPPYRSSADRKALINGLLDGTIDAVESQHTPLAIENKELEFEYANFGISGIEIAFQTIFSEVDKEVPIETLLEKFTIGAEFSANIPPIQMEVGEPARLILISTKGKTSVSNTTWTSRGKNTPFFNSELNGAVNSLID